MSVYLKTGDFCKITEKEFVYCGYDSYYIYKCKYDMVYIPLRCSSFFFFFLRNQSYIMSLVISKCNPVGELAFLSFTSCLIQGSKFIKF